MFSIVLGQLKSKKQAYRLVTGRQSKTGKQVQMAKQAGQNQRWKVYREKKEKQENTGRNR